MKVFGDRGICSLTFVPWKLIFDSFRLKLIPRFIEMARQGKPFPVQGSGDQLRSWLFVDDASEGILLAVEKGRVGQVYNLGTYLEKNGGYNSENGQFYFYQFVALIRKKDIFLLLHNLFF